MQKYSYGVRCDTCGASIKWTGLPEPLDVTDVLGRLGWTTYGSGSGHKCERCTERAASFDLAAIPALDDLDLDSIFGDKPKRAHY